MSNHTNDRRDPLEILAEPDRPLRPPSTFARELRGRLLDALGLDEPVTPIIDLPDRKAPMSDSTMTPIRTATAVPYITVRDCAAALGWYADVFGATEVMRVTAADGTVGHAEISIGGATIYLSDEHPDIGVVGPRTLGGTSFALHLTVDDDVDAVFGRAVDAGATSQMEPADQPHGARHGAIIDPYGHRWMLSQQIEEVAVDTYRDRAAEAGYTIETTSTSSPPRYGQIWAAMPYADAPAGIRFLTEVLGFEEQIVVQNPDDPDVIEHSQLRWPEGGILQAATANRPGNVYSKRPTGSESLYIVTGDPESVWERCQAAGVEVVDPPSSPEYAPDTISFSIRDPEGNIFTFGNYAGET